MFKTQIYLPEEDNRRIDQLAKLTSRSKSELIREAISSYLDSKKNNNLSAAFGSWKENDFDYQEARNEWQR